MKTDPRGRTADMTMMVIKQGAEPVAFKSYFVAWEPQMWNKKMSYEDQLNAIKQDNDKVDENAWSMVCLVYLAVVSREKCCVTTEVTPLRMRDRGLFEKGAPAPDSA